MDYLGVVLAVFGVFGLLTLPSHRASVRKHDRPARKSVILGVPMMFRASDRTYYQVTLVMSLASLLLGGVLILVAVLN